MTGRTTSPGPAERTRYHHGDLRTAMLRAAEQLVVEAGPEAVTVREVARRVGVSSGAPFHHFPTRLTLMTALAEDATSRLRTAVEAGVAGVPAADPRGRVRAMGRAYLRWAVENPSQFRVVSDRRLIEYTAAIEADNTAIQDLMRDTLRAAGGPDLDLGAAMITTRAVAYGLARMFVDGHLPRWGITGPDPIERMEEVLHNLVLTLIGQDT